LTNSGKANVRSASFGRAALVAASAAIVAAAVALVNRGAPARTRDSSVTAIHRIADLEGTIRALQSMGGRTTWDQQWQAARWIAGRFKATGLETTIEVYDHAGRSWPNVVAGVSGEPAVDDVVIVGAHLDSIARDSRTAPGADDNATGVAVAIQVARDLASARPQHTVVFAVFSNEEQGTIGSRSFARAARARHDRIKAVVNIDVLGYNRAPLGLLDVMGAHTSVRYQLKAAWLTFRNAAIGWRGRADSVTVGGREANRGLVERIGGAMGAVPGFSVKSLVDDACG
jgi:hypothetical protein